MDNYLRNSLLILVLLHSLCGQLTKVSSMNPPNYRKRIQEECWKITQSSRCGCSQSFMRINCPRGGMTPEISIDRSQADRVHIHCRRLDPIVYSHLPQMAIGSTPIVQISACPLLFRKVISDIFNILGITQVTELIFESAELHGSLKRIHFEGLRNLGKLVLRSNDLSSLPEDLFADLMDLTRLDIRSNVLRLPPGILRNQNKLTHLNLSSYKLIHLTKETFEGVASLRELDLISSNVTFHPGVFSFLTNINKINFMGNYINSLPDGLFSENKNLNVFRLYDNRVQLKTLPAKLLANLPDLREVRLSCGLETISEDLFDNSIYIRNITISENNLTELPFALFVYQSELINLDLSRNQLTSLPDDIFMDTENLRVLRLSQNHLMTITNRIFSSLSNLQMLYVDNNNIFTIHPEAFENTPKLIYISMENNQINLLESYNGDYDPTDQFDLESPFNNLKELQTLNLKNNSIPDIFSDWRFEVLGLRTLDLSYNSITKISTNYPPQNPSYDIFVNLSHNAIDKIHFDHMDSERDTLDYQIWIDLSDNPINCDCELLSFVEFVNHKFSEGPSGIIVSHNALQCSHPHLLKDRLISTLSTKELLCPLDYKNSNTKLCPDNCSCWERTADQIAIVNCSNANLTEVPVLPNLKQSKSELLGMELYIENNRLTNLPDANATGYEQVVQLHASNNSLTKVQASNLPKNLSFLNLSHNKIQHLNVSVLNTLNESRTISVLAGNPWICDCAAEDLLRFVQSNYDIIRDRKQIKCVDGKKLQDLHITSICTALPNLIIAVCILIVVVGLCVGIVTPLYYKYQHEIKVWLYAHGMCLWVVTERELDKNKKYDAFISYSNKDEDFIADYLLPELENGPVPFKLCLHIRDWVVGEFIPYQIVQSVEDSRRTIIVLSPNFIESVWARMEFRAAHSAALNEGRFRVIVILYGDIDNIDSLDPELKTYLQMNTYVKWGDPWFWKKLRYAMPHSPKNLS